jgi:hypothetical protein
MNKKELEQISKKEFWLSLGCIGIVFKQPDKDMTLEMLRREIIDTIVKDDIVLVEDEDFFGDAPIFNTTIGEGLGVIFNLTQPIYVSTISTPVEIEFEIDPAWGTAETKQNNKKIKVRIYYNGFVYCIITDMSTMPDNYRYYEHVRAIQKKFRDLITASLLWSIVESKESSGLIKVFVLPEEYTSDKERDDSGITFEYSRGSVIALSCIEKDNNNHSTEDVLDSVAYTAMYPYASEYYYCLLTETEIDGHVEKEKKLRNDITNSVLSFYDLKWINIFSRYSRSVKISKMVAQLYPLIPHIEKICNEYNYHFDKLTKSELMFGDVVEKPYQELLGSKLSKKDNLSFNVDKDMISHEVSEINSQVNYQFIFLTFLVAIIGIAASIIFTHK